MALAVGVHVCTTRQNWDRIGDRVKAAEQEQGVDDPTPVLESVEHMYKVHTEE